MFLTMKVLADENIFTLNTRYMCCVLASYTVYVYIQTVCLGTWGKGAVKPLVAKMRITKTFRKVILTNKKKIAYQNFFF